MLKTRSQTQRWIAGFLIFTMSSGALAQTVPAPSASPAPTASPATENYKNHRPGDVVSTDPKNDTKIRIIRYPDGKRAAFRYYFHDDRQQGKYVHEYLGCRQFAPYTQEEIGRVFRYNYWKGWGKVGVVSLIAIAAATGLLTSEGLKIETAENGEKIIKGGWLARLMLWITRKEKVEEITPLAVSWINQLLGLVKAASTISIAGVTIKSFGDRITGFFDWDIYFQRAKVSNWEKYVGSGSELTEHPEDNIENFAMTWKRVLCGIDEEEAKHKTHATQERETAEQYLLSGEAVPDSLRIATPKTKK